MKTALVYDWFSDDPGGGEKVFEAIYHLFPSPIYTLLDASSSNKQFEKVHTSFIQNLPFARKKYRSYLPFFPMAIEQFDLSDYDLILSCSHCVVKGVMTHAEQLHICYCFTPMRYAWDLYHQYLEESQLNRGLKANLARMFLHYLRMWDFQTATRPDVLGAISHYVAKRIQKTYGRSATVIYPPVDTDFFTLQPQKSDYYLAASRFVPYKKMELIIEAFARMPDKKLVVIGDGPEFKRAKAKATKNIELLGYQPANVLKEHLQQAKAFVFAAVEDFGILPVEAQACGTPVIAFGKGAVRETVQENVTGVFFSEQTVSAIIQAVHGFEQNLHQYVPTEIRAHAERFQKPRFVREYKNWVEKQWQRFQELPSCATMNCDIHT